MLCILPLAAFGGLWSIWASQPDERRRAIGSKDDLRVILADDPVRRG
jgi:hypothetical protein